MMCVDTSVREGLTLVTAVGDPLVCAKDTVVGMICPYDHSVILSVLFKGCLSLNGFFGTSGLLQMDVSQS